VVLMMRSRRPGILPGDFQSSARSPVDNAGKAIFSPICFRCGIISELQNIASVDDARDHM